MNTNMMCIRCLSPRRGNGPNKLPVPPRIAVFGLKMLLSDIDTYVLFLVVLLSAKDY